MPYSPTTALRGAPRGNPDAIAAWAIANGAARPDDVRAYLETVYRLAPALGLNPDVIAAQSHLETDGWRSLWWATRANPAGIGITGDARQNAISRDFLNGDAAARAHLLHLSLYVNGDTVPSGFLATDDPRWDAAVEAGYAGIADTLEDLNRTWAIDPQDNYHGKIAGRLNEMEAAGLLPADVEERMAPLHIILVAGHNSVGDGGNPTERALTPKLANAYLKAFQDAGIPVEWVNPTLTPGGLDGLASLTARRIRDADATLVVALDLHFNGSTSGVHVIPAHNRKSNGGTLSTAIVAGRVAADVMDNNTLDVSFAGAMARAIVAANPGMTLWGATGIMPESQTGVGLKGYRLAMMAYSAPWRDKSIRVTVEHGGTNDTARENFYARCANAAVATVKTVLGTRIDVPPAPPDPDEPEPPEGDTGKPSLPAFLFGEAAGYSYDPDGPVSQLWMDHGNKAEHRRWPRLVDVEIDGTVKRFVFADGTVIVAEPGKPVAYLDKLAA